MTWVLGLKVDRDVAARTLTISCGARIRAMAERFGVTFEGSRRYETPADVAILNMEDGETI